MMFLRIGIYLLVVFAVLAHGAVEAWSSAVVEIGAAILFVCWAVRVLREEENECRWDALLWPLLGFWGFGLVQCLAGLSVYPYLTKVELLRLSAYLLLFFLALQGFRTQEHWREFAWFLLVLAFTVSVFGIVQHYSFNGKLYWVRELPPGGIPFGPYVNRNHFAGLIELLAPVGLAILVLRAVRRDVLPLAALFTLFPIGALFLAASRGGIASLFFQLLLLGILIWWRRGGRTHLAAAGVVLVLAAALVAWLGVGRALERFSKFQALEVTEARRVVMIRDSWHIFLDHPWKGTGLGTLPDVYPRYENVYDGKIVNHAHNDYVEALADTGVIGGMTCMAFLLLLIRRALANLRTSRDSLGFALHLGALVACAGILVHSLVDFNLHIPSNALLFFLQAALASSAIPTAPRD